MKTAVWAAEPTVEDVGFRPVADKIQGIRAVIVFMYNRVRVSILAPRI